MGYLVFSVKGISDEEMEDLLSLDDKLLDDIFQYHKSEIRRVPTHVWQRLKLAMKDLVVEGDQGCLKLYHRQLIELARKRYQPIQSQVCKIMAEYSMRISILAEINYLRQIEGFIVPDHTGHLR